MEIFRKAKFKILAKSINPESMKAVGVPKKSYAILKHCSKRAKIKAVLVFLG